jgi:hypothetical protein
MFTKKDVRDWMIQHDVYGGDIEKIDNRLNYCLRNDYVVRTISADFDDDGNELEYIFDNHFADIGSIEYSKIPDGESTTSYLDVLDRL